MRLHKERDVVDARLSQPLDEDESKQLDKNFQIFSRNVQNVRLRLATDAFIPFKNFIKSYCVWLVIIIVHNLPPSMVPRPRSPTKDLNVYLRLLVDELNILWGT